MKIHGGKLEVGEAEVGVDMMTLKYCLTLALESTSWRGVLGMEGVLILGSCLGLLPGYWAVAGSKMLW